MAKIVKKKMARSMTPPSWATEAMRVEIKSLMDGMVVKLLNGLINLNVLIPLTDYNCGISVNKELTTTMKSSQFQASLK